jgi:cell wall-associated NlpC family hydrolase
VNLIKRAALPVALGAALLAPLTPAQAADTAATGAVKAAGVEAKAVTPTTVINRAKTWLTAVNGHQVPYSQTATHGGYRTDCSGYVSMALQLPKPGPNTVGLASSTYTTKITKGQLKKGDLVIDANGSSTTRHVVIFEKWTSSAKTAYRAYEQRGGHGTDYSTRSYGLGSDQYDFYRPKKY